MKGKQFGYLMSVFFMINRSTWTIPKKLYIYICYYTSWSVKRQEISRYWSGSRFMNWYASPQHHLNTTVSVHAQIFWLSAHPQYMHETGDFHNSDAIYESIFSFMHEPNTVMECSLCLSQHNEETNILMVRGKRLLITSPDPRRSLTANLLIKRKSPFLILILILLL